MRTTLGRLLLSLLVLSAGVAPAAHAGDRNTYVGPEGHTWTLRPVKINVDRFLPEPSSHVEARYHLTVTDGRVLAFPPDAVGATVTRGSWITEREVQVVRGGLTSAFAHAFGAITAAAGFVGVEQPAAAERKRLPGIEVVIEKYWFEPRHDWQPILGNGGADMVMRIACHMRRAGATDPEKSLAFSVETGRWGDPWENGLEELLPYFAALIEREDVRAVITAPWEEIVEEPPARTKSGPPVVVQIAAVVDDRGHRTTGALVAQSPDTLCLATESGSRLFVRASLESEDLRAIVLPPGSLGRQWAMLPPGEAGLVVRQTTTAVTIRLAEETAELAYSDQLWTGRAVTAPEPGTLCAAVR